MPDPIKLLSPRGQLVQGHPMKRKAVMDDKTGQHKINKRSEKRYQKFFAVAYPKGNSDVEAMVAKIKSVGPIFFDSKIAAIPTFAWKVEDGDSTAVDKSGKCNSKRKGFPGCHIIKFSTELSDVPTVCDEGKGDLLEEGEFKPGDYVRVGFSVNGNNSKDSPGLYINPLVVQRMAKGDAIYTQRTAAEEIDQFDEPQAPAPKPAQDFGMGTTPPPPPAPTGPKMVINAQGHTQPYDAMIAQKWTDESMAASGWKVVE